MGKNARNKNLSSREQARLVASKQTGGGSSGLGVKLGIGLGVVALAAIIVAVVIGVNKSNNSAFDVVNQPSVVKDLGIIVGADRKIVESTPKGTSNIVIYQDYICPGCKAFETNYSAELDKVLDDGVATVEYRSLGMLDSMSAGTNYSSRAANVATCAAVAAPDKFYDLNKLFYANQPAEGTAGLANAELITLAGSLGITGIDSCVADGTYRGFVKKVTDYAINDEKIEGTPTILLNGKKTELGGSLYDMVVEANKTLATS